MIIPISNISEPKVCFYKDGFIFCSWVTLKRMPGYALISDVGKFIKFPAYNKKEKDPDNESESSSDK